MFVGRVKLSASDIPALKIARCNVAFPSTLTQKPRRQNELPTGLEPEIHTSIEGKSKLIGLTTPQINQLELELLQAIEDRVDAGEEVPRIKDLVELLLADGAARISLETLLKGGTGDAILHLVPGSHGVFLHDRIGIFAGDARIDEGQQDLGGEDETASLVEVGHHASRIQLQAVNNANETLEHVVECDKAIGLGDALGRGVRNVALMPQGDIVESDLGIGLHDARQATDLLHGDRVALVRHGGAALLTLAERLLGLERIGLLQIANLGSDALAGGRRGGEDAGEVGMMVAGDDLRGQRVVDQTQALADVLLDERLDGAVGADGTGDGTEGNILASVLKTIEIALELPRPRAELHTEGHRLGMNAVGAAGAERIALLEGAALADHAELLDVLDNQVTRLSKLIAQSRITQVGAGHTVVNPAARLGLALGNIGVDIFLHVGQEGDDIVARDFLDLVDLCLLKVGMVADPLGFFFRNADLAELRLGLAGQDLNLLPNGVLVLEGEDVSHLRAGIAIDHSGSFLVIGTLVVTQPLYRARVRVWAAGINLTFCSIERAIKTTPKRGGLLLGYNPKISGTRLKAPALTGFGPHCRLTRDGPVKPALFAPRPPIEGVLVLLDAQPVERDVGLLLLPDVLRDRGLVQADGGYAVALGPELPVAELVLHVRVPVEYHQRALPLQVAHHARHAVLRRYRQQHVDVVGHQVPLDDLYPLVLAELPEDLPKVGPYLVVDDFAPILRREHDVVLAHPLRVRQAVGLLGHTPPPPSRLGFLAA